MQFINSSDPKMGQDVLISLINDSLKNSKVLYLLSGGSNIDIEVAVLDGIDSELSNNLTLMLADERYGPSNHQESNYTKLINKGLNVKNSAFINILSDDLSPEETTDLFSQIYSQYKEDADIIVAQLGIGNDGHIAGVLPDTEGVNSQAIAVYYETETLKRITLTLNTLKDIDKAIVFCFGDNKRDALRRLRDGEEDTNQLPSVILKELADVIVYNDQI